MTFIESMDIVDAIDLFEKAILKREEERLWDLYLVHFSKMNKENYFSFDDYKKRMFKNDEQAEMPNETVQDTFNKFKMKIMQPK